jgi:N-acetylglucosamine-6-sulfatase
MDRLAEEGVLFSNAFVTTSLCSPSRASFLTGQYAHNHGVQNNTTAWNNNNITFLEFLKQVGHDTAFIGKWHMPGQLPQLRGVDRFITFTVEGGQGHYFNCPLIVDGVDTPSRKPYITEELTDYALEFIERDRSTPFCLYLSHKAVHHQFLPPPELDHLYDDKKMPLPREADFWLAKTDGNMVHGLFMPLDHYWRNYCEALVALDRQIGRLLTRLVELGISENTMVIYASDNGYSWGEHRNIDKRWPYEEPIRIPFIARYPKVTTEPGRTAPQMVLNIDLAPTLLDLAGVAVPEQINGESFLPILRSRAAPGREAWLYEYFKDFPYNVPASRAVRTNTHMYMEFEGKRKPELYDTASDPGQAKNLMGTAEADALLPYLRETLEALMKDKKF